MQKYSPEEVASIVHALNLLSEKGFPISPEIFDAWCSACVTVPYELAVLKESVDCRRPEVLMVYRKDAFFTGWHIPGTIILPGDTEESALARLQRKEIFGKTSTPTFVDRMHVMKGPGPEEILRGQSASLLFACMLEGEECSGGTFFPLHNPPEDTLNHHKRLLKRIARWWDKQPS